MKCNLGKTERIIRIAASLVLVALGAAWWAGFYVIGAVIFVTALVAWCPIYTVLGISTCRGDEEEIPVDSTSTDKDRLIRERRFK